MSDIYSMKIHEQIEIEREYDTLFITRVPGGWIYQIGSSDHGTFVPYSNEGLQAGGPPIGNPDDLDELLKEE